MEKKIVFQLAVVCLFFIFASACDDTANQKTSSTSEIDTTKPVARRLAYRTGIDSSNSYTNLFVDSSRLEKFMIKESIPGEPAEDIRGFYNNRAFQFAWFTDSGFTEQALAFRSLYDYDKDSGAGRKQLDNKLDRLINTDSLAPDVNDPQINATELEMSWRLANYFDKKFPDNDKRYALLEELVPYKKQPAADWISNMDKHPVKIATSNQWYDKLAKSLQELSGLEKNGGWDTLPVAVKKYNGKNGTDLIARLKKRLIASRLLLDTDTSAAITPSFQTAIKNAQSAYGYAHDTILTSTLLKELNVPVGERIKQVIINLQRMQWMPDMPDKEYIFVNIPAFKLYVRKGDQSAFFMDIITGKEGHSTVTFSGSLNQIVFSPYWNLTDSIVKKEVLPHLKKNKRYLEEQHMEKTGERHGLPVIRQLPGEWNELGKVKFLFPNSQQIYFHDTPHKWLFNKDRRAYSHGCIRLAEPAKLAQFLLKDNPEWTKQAIDSAMNSEKERFVKLSTAVPVFIYYYTAWVDESGVLQFRKDIYGHDADMAKRLF